MPGAGTGSNFAGRIIRDDIGDILDPFSVVLERNEFIGHRIAPLYGVSQPMGDFPKRLLAQYLKRVDTKRMEDGTANRIYVSIGEDSFRVRPYEIEFPIDNWQNASIHGTTTFRDRWNYEMDGINLMRDVMAREYEIAIASEVQGATNYPETWQTLATAKPWSDPTADILGDIEALRRQRDTKMIPANALICSERVFRQFTMNHGIMSRFSSDGAGYPQFPSQFTRARLADLFNVKEIIVGGGYYDDTNETTADTDNKQGFGDLNLQSIWKDNAVYLGIVIPSGQRPSFTRPSFAYTMQWTRGPGGRGERIIMYPEPRRDGYVYRLRSNYDIKVFGNMTYSRITGTWAD